MIKSLKVTNHLGESLVLELMRPEKSGLIVREISGLGPSKANINTSDVATMDGSVYNSSRRENRNIVLDLMMYPFPTIEDSRLLTYRYFPIKKQVRLEIETDNLKVHTYGYVESNEPDIFSEEESTQISIICPDPNFYDVVETSTAFSGVEPMFEFPFSNESLTEPLLEFGALRIDSRAIINYKGSIETGVEITLHALDRVDDITLYNTESQEFLKIDTAKVEQISGAPLGMGDDIIVTTKVGGKTARLLRNGTYTNILGALDRDSSWFQLSPGDNIFSYDVTGSKDDLMITFTYQSAYGGV